MVNKHDRKCWLCLQPVKRNNHVLFNEIHREILEVLLTNDVNKCVKSVICTDCSKMLHESFTFKSSCLYTEDSITPFINSQNLDKLDISTIFRKINISKRNLFLRNKNICRFCLKIIENISFTFLKDLNEPDMEMLKKVVPEMQLEAVKEPIICETCLYCFKDCFKFISGCLNALKQFDNVSTTNSSNNSDSVCLENEIESTKEDLIVSKVEGKNPRKHNENINPKRKGKCVKNPGPGWKKGKTNLTANDHKEQCIVYECDNCNYKSLYKSTLYKHSLLHKDTADIEMYKCEYCPFETIYKQSFERHTQLHEENSFTLKKFKCHICNFRTKTATCLNSHLYSHETSNIQTYQCNKCPFVTKYKNSLMYHMVIHEDIPTLKCPLCSYETKHKRCLDAHRATHNKERSYTCDECGFKTTGKDYLAKHLRNHLNARLSTEKYSCELCPFKTKNANSLKAHQIIHKEPREMFKCDICGFVTRYKVSLRRHMHVHKDSETRVHKCDKCPFQSRDKYRLTIHKLVHNNPEKAKLYKCQLCQFSAEYKSDLRRHQLEHLNRSDVKVFQCTKCDFKTKTKCVLTKHMILHMNVFYKCELCNFKTRYEKWLPHHVKNIHQGLTSYKCQLCQFSTKDKIEFRQHQLAHKDPSEVKVFQCAKCDFKTHSKHSLINHVVLHMDVFYKCELCSYKTRHKRDLYSHCKQDHE